MRTVIAGAFASPDGVPQATGVPEEDPKCAAVDDGADAMASRHRGRP